MIKAHSEVLNKNSIVNAAFKFQFRNLDTFIHKKFKGSTDVKHISRFEETRLSLKDYQILYDEIKNQGYKTMCTAFDEESVESISKMKFDIILSLPPTSPLREKKDVVDCPQGLDIINQIKGINLFY